MSERLLILETSGRTGTVALATSEVVLASRRLDESRRHARDLAPAITGLVAEVGWSVPSLTGIIASRGPGSYTGLRVGLMSAKALAYALGCPLLAIDTFPAIATQAPSSARAAVVIADAQQHKVYVQRFAYGSNRVTSIEAIAVRPLAEIVAALRPGDWLAGAGVGLLGESLPHEITVAAPADCQPRPESLLRLALPRIQAKTFDDPFTLEPLYLRPSSAEEQWTAAGKL